MCRTPVGGERHVSHSTLRQVEVPMRGTVDTPGFLASSGNDQVSVPKPIPHHLRHLLAQVIGFD